MSPYTLSAFVRKCTGKHQHSSRQKAIKHIHHIVSGRGANPNTLDAYHCEHCGSWHVGNNRTRTWSSSKSHKFG